MMNKNTTTIIGLVLCIIVTISLIAKNKSNFINNELPVNAEIVMLLMLPLVCIASIIVFLILTYLYTIVRFKKDESLWNRNQYLYELKYVLSNLPFFKYTSRIFPSSDFDEMKKCDELLKGLKYKKTHSILELIIKENPSNEDAKKMLDSVNRILSHNNSKPPAKDGTSSKLLNKGIRYYMGQGEFFLKGDSRDFEKARDCYFEALSYDSKINNKRYSFNKDGIIELKIYATSILLNDIERAEKYKMKFIGAQHRSDSYEIEEVQDGSYENLFREQVDLLRRL